MAQLVVQITLVQFICHNILPLSMSIWFQNSSLTFYANTCIMQDLSSKRVIGQVHQQGNLCHVTNPLVSLYVSSIFINQLKNQRLEDAFDDTLSHFHFGLKFQCKPRDTFHKAKQHILPFNQSSVQPTCVFKLINIDL